MMQKTTLHIRLTIWSLILSMCLTILTVGCTGKEDSDATRDTSQSSSAGFRFLDLNAASRLDDSLRRELREKLGSDAIWRRVPLDIEINYDGFLKEHFDELYRLNQRLNYAPRERVEHDITKLMYRFPQKKNLPFSYIELIFYNNGRAPLVFKIEAKRDGDAVVATLEDKYGPPGQITWNSGRDRALFWRKPGEIMIASIVADQYGQPEYGISIFFTDHIKSMVETEEEERRQLQKEKEKAGKTAF